MAKQTKLKTLKGRTSEALLLAAKCANDLAKHTQDPGHAAVAHYLVQLGKSVQDVQMGSGIISQDGQEFASTEEEKEEE